MSRAGYYRFLKPVAEQAEEMELRDAIQKLAVEMPAYGYRRITMALRRGGWVVNHKRVLRLMRADNLLCLRRRAFVLSSSARIRFANRTDCQQRSRRRQQLFSTGPGSVLTLCLTKGVHPRQFLKPLSSSK